jgi:tetratricopeptide (TPR) repeat protein
MKEKKTSKNEMEKLTADLTRALQEHNFDNVVDLEQYMKKMMKGKKPSAKINRKAERAAQELIYDAWEEGKRSERIRLAKKAITIFPDCADAYNLLAQDAAKSLEEAGKYYEQGMEAGRRALGEKIFKDSSGHFWGMMETRPYMRSCAGLMQCLWDEGKHDAAISQAKKMLTLNHNDNQGIRYILISYLANLERYDELDKFMNKGDYNGDCMAEWLYTRALLSFVKNGASKKAEKELAAALQRNVHVPKYLTGEKPILLCRRQYQRLGNSTGCAYLAYSTESGKMVAKGENA